MSDEQIYYGIVDNSGIDLHGPRAIEGDEVEALRHAFAAAYQAIADGDYDQIAIVRCRYYGEDGNGYWGEDTRFLPIEIDARDAPWAADDE